MLEVIGKGKTLEAATEDALQQLGVSREEVDIDPLSVGSKGFLGIGSKPARVRVIVKNNSNVQVNVFMRTLLEHLNIDTELTVDEKEDDVLITLGEEASHLIGHHGQTLDALQYIVSRVLNGDKEDWKKVTVDIDHYREKRDENLKDMALKLAEKVIHTQRDTKTQPLSGGERRIIHMTLKENTEITTFSIGSGDKKRVVIALNNRENGRSGVDEEKRRPRGGGRGRGGGNRSNSGRKPGDNRAGNKPGENRGGGGNRRGGRSGGGRGRGPKPSAPANSE